MAKSKQIAPILSLCFLVMAIRRFTNETCRWRVSS
jgi:hypothetical protein